ncbi:unnamed protein product [Meganyctiphanes norvegica]|uniref:BAH domain-containing protein n=1 Tax=Meganyctiphanes norvegica TaxID=48144 RepID=A0AAV2QUP7_MEGNR
MLATNPGSQQSSLSVSTAATTPLQHSLPHSHAVLAQLHALVQQHKDGVLGGNLPSVVGAASSTPPTLVSVKPGAMPPTSSHLPLANISIQAPTSSVAATSTHMPLSSITVQPPSTSLSTITTPVTLTNINFQPISISSTMTSQASYTFTSNVNTIAIPTINTSTIQDLTVKTRLINHDDGRISSSGHLTPKVHCHLKEDINSNSAKDLSNYQDSKVYISENSHIINGKSPTAKTFPSKDNNYLLNEDKLNRVWETHGAPVCQNNNNMPMLSPSIKTPLSPTNVQKVVIQKNLKTSQNETSKSQPREEQYFANIDTLKQGINLDEAINLSKTDNKAENKSSTDSPLSWKAPMSPNPLAPLVGDQCSRTTPGLLQAYAEGRRSRSDTTLTTTVTTSASARSSLSSSCEVSTVITNVSAPPPIVALTQLAVPNVAPPTSAAAGDLSKLRKTKLEERTQASITAANGIPIGIAVGRQRQETRTTDDAPAGPIQTIPVVSAVPTIPTAPSGGVTTIPIIPSVSVAPPTSTTLPTHWSLPPTPCTPGIPPSPFWLTQNQYTGLGVESGVGGGLGLGYQFARDPITGHLLLLGQYPHPLPDPGGHGLVWAGYGSMAATPPVVMSPQQLLLPDTHYHRALQAHTALLQIPHSHAPSIHSSQQSPTVKRERPPTPSLSEDDSKSRSVSIPSVTHSQMPEVVTAQASSDIPLSSPMAAAAVAAAGLRHLPPPFLFPPQSSIPYFCSQSPHAAPFPLNTYPHSAATVSSIAATSLSTVAITSATSTYTNTLTNLSNLSTTFSSIPETPVSSIFAKSSDCYSVSSAMTPTTRSESTEPINVTSQSDDESEDDLALHKTQNISEPRGPPVCSLPLNLCSTQTLTETAPLMSPSMSEHSNSRSTTENAYPVQLLPLRIKQEIKEEIPSPVSHSADYGSFYLDKTMDTHQIMSRNPKIMVKLEIKNIGSPEVRDNLFSESPKSSLKSLKTSSPQLNKPSIAPSSKNSSSLVISNKSSAVTTDTQEDEPSTNLDYKISTSQSDFSAQHTPDIDLSGLELLSRSVLQHANKLPEDKSQENNSITCSCQASQLSSVEPVMATSHLDLDCSVVSSLPPRNESPPPPLLEVPPPPPISLSESPPPPLLFSVTSISPALATPNTSNRLSSTDTTTITTTTTTTTTASTSTTSAITTTNLPTPTSGLSGLSLLCALAEQRILEEEKEEQVACPALSSLADIAAATSPNTPLSFPKSFNAFHHYQQQARIANNSSPLSIQTNLETDHASAYHSAYLPSDSLLIAAHEVTCPPAHPSFSHTPMKSVDINRNYKSPQSEREAKAFIANKASQYQKEGSFNFKMPCGFPVDSMNASELDMRMRLAELQRKYRETQRELSRLQPKAKASCSPKRGPGRPPKRKIQNNGGPGKKKVGRPPNSKKRSLQKELSPPVLERVTDLEIKSLTKYSDDERDDTGSESRSILKPPVLTATFTNYRDSSSISNSSPTTFMTQISTEKEESSDEDSSSKMMRRWSFSSEDTTPPVLVSPFKLPVITKEPRLEESEEEPSKDHLSDSSGSQSKVLHTETSVESSPSDMELHSVSSSSSKKRKVGRPKKHSPTKEDATETIVAKKPKTLSFLLQNRPLLSNKTKIKPKLKAEVKVRGEEEDEDDSPFRISYKKLSSPDSVTKEASDEDDDQIPKLQQISPRVSSESRGRKRGLPRGRTSFSRRAILRDKEKRKFAAEKQSHMEALFRSLKKHSKMAYAGHDESDDESEMDDDQDDKDSEAGFVGFEDSYSLSPCPLSAVAAAAAAAAKEANIALGHSSASDNEESVYSPESITTITPTSNPLKFIATTTTVPQVTTAVPTTPEEPSFAETSFPAEGGNTPENIQPKSSTQNTEVSVCTVDQSDLDAGARVLTLQDGLLYAGHVVPITAPDIYGVIVDGERGSRPHVYCREELLQQSWKEVKPGSSRYLPEGTRVCAFWSNQYRGLYPGSVAASSSPSHDTNHNLINVEFDDGDSGKIHVDDIRLLPPDFPISEYDPNPLMTLNKRKRRPTADSSAERRSTSGSTNRKKRTISGCDNLLGNNEDHLQPQELDVNNEIEKENQNSENLQSKMKKKEYKNDTKTTSKKEEKKKHKKHKSPDSHHHKHRHKSKHKHKRRESEGGLQQPHIERGDSEFSMRIVSPPPPVGDNRRNSAKEALESKKEKKEDDESQSEDESEEEDVASEESISEEESEDDYTPATRRRSKSTSPARSRKKRRHPSGKSKIAPFLLERQLWRWSGKGFKRPGAKGKGKKEFFKAIVRGKEMIRVGDCAVFLSAGQPDRPYIGRIELMWESWGGNMVVKVKWFYHPQETTGLGNRLSEHRGALFQSPHTDENDVQTISHKCDVIALSDYKVRRSNLEKEHGSSYENYDLYYLAGFYDPGSGHITMEPGVS